MASFVRILACVGLIVTLAAPLAGCNTVEGIGRDARAAGDAISGAARDTKGY